MAHKSDSSVQMKSEKVILAKLEELLNLPKDSIETEVIKLNSRSTVEIDGFNKEHGIMVEVFSRIGKPKAAHQEKIANDILKLMMIEKIHEKSYRKIMAVCDEEIEKYMLGNSWKAHALRLFEFEVVNVDVGIELRNQIIEAQGLQSEGMKL